MRKRLPFTKAKDWTVPAVFVALLVCLNLGFLDDFDGWLSQCLTMLAIFAVCWDMTRDLSD